MQRGFHKYNLKTENSAYAQTAIPKPIRCCPKWPFMAPFGAKVGWKFEHRDCGKAHYKLYQRRFLCQSASVAKLAELSCSQGVSEHDRQTEATSASFSSRIFSGLHCLSEPKFCSRLLLQASSCLQLPMTL